MMDRKAHILSGAQAIVECLKRESVTKVFCVPGESYLPVMDAILDEPSMDLVSARHEGGASFMAEGFAKASGNPGVVMATRGVGASNLSIGVHTAAQDSTPMVVFLGQVHSQFRGREGFQEVDLDQYFKPIAKWTVEILEPARIPELVQRAFRVACTGRPGPVIVSLPEDVLVKKSQMEFGEPVIRPSPRPSSKEVDLLEQVLLKAERPLILAGGGVKLAGAEDALVGFAEKYDLPVMAAFRRHDVFPNHHNLYIGHLGLGAHKNIIESVKESDVILAIGTRLSEVTTQDYSLLSKEQTLVHIDIDFETIGKVYSPDLGIVADAEQALVSFMHLGVTPVWSAWAEGRRRKYEATLHDDENKSSDLYRIISILEQRLPTGTILTNDAGNFAGWLHKFYRFKEKNTYIGPTSGAMGYGMPAALGAKLAHPDKTVISLSGDGGFMMTMQEMETAVRYHIPVISIIFNNRMYGTIRMHQEIHYPYKTIGTDLGDVPFSTFAEDLGAAGFYVRGFEEFERALVEALNYDKPVVIEVETDPEQISVSSTIQQLRKRHKQ
ncbi:acetolactate synthase [Halobacillus sp. KCTC 3957]|uniref:Acetolactate synthase n=2 Tax=Halobacillus yeomjeoni TaxID=311194 RepID=A0A931MTH1_9BACI|nr:thiamine pyrophosphate-dependent enzyme [Halobacillus yeomjeoni]MBH0228913.1 acetolactate synthase [Halobacillus yeomjeoni]